ncbi:MAG TPA: hypothetical protein VFT32_11280, partial [Candidatus Eisenbacteria bacterium]|nr:hypothetical protein [Candidatus Eisenbacteria bacterium]
MSLSRLAAVFRVELAYAFRRPLVLFLALVLLLSGFGLSTGKMQISSGDSSVGGMKAWITSEFAQTQMMTYIVLLYYAFFLAAAAGLSLHRDRETKVDTLLHATPLRAGEYVWGRYLAVLAAFALLMLWQALVNAFFNHALPNGAAEEIRGPFLARSYLMPVATLGIPFLIFFAGFSMLVGERARSPVLVFVLPVAVLLACAFFLWTWSPSWLDPGVNRALQILEPSGYRWLQETYLRVDRGVAFYNREPVPYDAAFWLNRAWLVLFGLGAVVLTQRSMARAMRGAVRPARPERRADRAELDSASPGLDAALPAMTASAPSFLASAAAVARGEARELLRHGGLYIFVPLILLQCLGNTLVATGAFDTPVLLTPGTTAVGVAGQITVFLCLLLLYYMVESLERDRATGLAPILYATPARTGALLLGKAAALSLVGASVFLACLIACGIALAVQRTIPFSIVPYALVWGCLLVPTFLAWTAFVAAVYALTGNRLGAIALSLGALLFSGYRALTGGMSWAGNWPLWGVLRWSDLGFMEADRSALVWNRIMVLGLAVLFGALAVRLFGRTTADAVRTVHRLRPREWARQGRALLPYAVVPAVACGVLLVQVSQGPQGGAAKKARKDYWARNLKTWLDAPLPDIARADVRLRLDPRTSAIASDGTFTLVNPTDSVIARIPITGGA